MDLGRKRAADLERAGYLVLWLGLEAAEDGVLVSEGVERHGRRRGVDPVISLVGLRRGKCAAGNSGVGRRAEIWAEAGRRR